MKTKEPVEGKELIIEAFHTSKTSPLRTGLAASSVIEKSLDGTFKQNHQVCLLHESGMRCEIKEYQIQWSEKEEKSTGDIHLIGKKHIFFRRSFDVHQEKKLNFIPKFNDQNYLIEGTQIIPTDFQSNQDHVVIDHKKCEDFDFRGELLNSDVKIYLDQNCQETQKYIIFETRVVPEKIGDGQFNFKDLNYLLEQHIVTMMNTVPVKDLRTIESMFTEEDFDFLQPLEILLGNSQYDYMS